MRTLLIGEGGFIGTYVLKALLEQPKNSVVVFDLEIDKIQKKRWLQNLDQRIFWEQGDILSLNTLQQVLGKYKIDQVIHLASLLMDDSEKNSSLAIRVNCEGLNNVFLASRKAKIQKVVWASSIAVYGSPEQYDAEVLDNTAQFQPDSIYGCCKSFCEYLGNYYQKRGVANIGLRFCLIYGPGRALATDSKSNFINDLVENAVASRQWFSVPYGEESFNFLYVEDAARAVVFALQPESQVGTYTICGDYRSLKEMAAYVKNLVPEAKIRLQPGKFDLCWRHDMKLALEGLGYFPEYPMEKGIEKYIEALKS